MKTKPIIAIILISLFLTGCMTMGSHRKMGMGKSVLIPEVKKLNKNDKMDRAIEKAVDDLMAQTLDVSNIAIWRIQSQSAGFDVDLLRAKLITDLVSRNTFQVISRDRLDELLDEQELSLSGMIDENSALEMGRLLGVDGFISGYASFNNNRLLLTLHLIESVTGKIVWSISVESE
ncbi:MAG: CsgG/HfaB family protein [Fidelibacterota bacterium]